jgi:hypothetical protein
VKAGDGEVLSQCHRLRSREVALQQAPSSNLIELKDMIVFFIPGATRGKYAIAILVDSPARVTEGGVIFGSN